MLNIPALFDCDVITVDWGKLYLNDKSSVDIFNESYPPAHVQTANQNPFYLIYLKLYGLFLELIMCK